jgi:hypothetical protein
MGRATRAQVEELARALQELRDNIAAKMLTPYVQDVYAQIRAYEEIIRGWRAPLPPEAELRVLRALIRDICATLDFADRPTPLS